MTNQPRWEWRTFGVEFGPADTAIGSCSTNVGRGDEVHLVGDRTDLDVTIRDGVIYFKRRLRVEHGLEQWSPVLTASFPLSRGDVAYLLRRWHMTAAVPIPEVCTQPEFISLVTLSTPPLRAVDVSETRWKGELEHCDVELGDLFVNGRPSRTVALKALDPAHVQSLVRRLGLTRFDNRNYVAAFQGRLGAARTAHAPGGDSPA